MSTWKRDYSHKQKEKGQQQNSQPDFALARENDDLDERG